MSHLRDLVKHAMHRALNISRQGVSGVYDVATLCDCQSLRLRAMRMFKDIKRGSRPRAGRPDHERHGGGGGSHGRSSGNHHHHARPRGLSDAYANQPTSSGGEQGQSYTNGQTNGVSHTVAVKDAVGRQDIATKSTLMRRPSRKSSLGMISDLEPVEEHPYTPRHFYKMESYSRSTSSNGISEILGSSMSEDEDSYDLDLLGLDPSFIPQERSWTPSAPSRVSHNTRPSLSRSSSSRSRRDNDDYYFGTEPDQSPLTAAFPPPDKTPVYHLPYTMAHRPSGSATFSDAPSLEESRSFGTVSTYSSAPVTPLSPALAEIVDAVSKVTVATTTSSGQLSRQASIRSTKEAFMSDERPSMDSGSDTHASLSHFPLPPSKDVSVQQKLLKIQTSLSNISEIEAVPSPSWMKQDDAYVTVQSPTESVISFDMLKFGASSRSLSRKSSSDMLTLSERTTPVPQSGGTFSRLLRSRRSSSTLEKETKARSKAEKLELKINEVGERERSRSFSDKESTSFGLLSGLWSPLSPRGPKTDEKRRKKEADKQKLREVMEASKARAAETKNTIPSEPFALARVSGL